MNSIYRLYLIPFLIISLTIGGLTSCQKYEEGPAFTLKSKTARLTQEWQVISFNGEVAEVDDDVYILEFSNDGDFEETILYADGTDNIRIGTWEWQDSKETVRVFIDGNISDLAVTKLTSDEFWFNYDGDEWKLEKF